MSDLISREALMKYMRDYKWEFALNSDFSKAIEMVDVQPTVEAKEVVHAKWIDGCCSNCGAYIPTDSRIDFIDEEDCKFCYECGCDMRGENYVE